MLDDFIAANRDELIRRCRAKASARAMDQATTGTDHGVPLFLDQLRNALRLGVAMTPEIGMTAVQHGHDLLLRGFTVSEVVRDYGDICQSITELALDLDAPISTDDFRTLNQCLDEAIAGAVTEYGRDRTTRDPETEPSGNERVGFFIHEMRNLISTATYAFEVLKTGNVPIGGSTGKVLQRSLAAQRALVAGSFAGVRLTQGVQHREAFLVAEFVDEVAAAASLEANARDVRLAVMCAENDAKVEADRQVLAAVVTNLLQNAFKFTKPATTVTLRVGASSERVLIEVQDECGGLPGGNTADLFRPFEQRGADRTGLGLGLAFCRSAVEANHGRIYARSLPDHGCIFAVDLPRLRLAS